MVADLIALVIVVGLLGIGGKSIFSAWKRSDEHNRAHEAEQAQMRNDLRLALASHDYRKLDDFIALWGDKVDGGVVKHIKQRRDELYIEGNP